MAPKKDTTVTPIRTRLPRAAKDKLKESPETIPMTTPKTIKKTAGRPKKVIPKTASTSKASSARDAKGKGKETELVTPEVPSDSAHNDQIIRQEATYPNPFSTDSSRRNTAALLSKWDSTKSPGFLSPESEKRLVNGIPKSKSPKSAKSKHERASLTLNGRHIAIPPPASKDRGEQTSQLFDLNKQHRLSSLAEGKFPDPTYPRASISGLTGTSPGFSAAMGFRYSPGFGGPRGFNTSPRSQFGFSKTRNGSAAPGTEGLSSSDQTKQADPTADAGPSDRADGVGAGLSPYKDIFTFPEPEPPVWQNSSMDWDNFLDWNQNRLSGQNYGQYNQYLPGSFGQLYGPHGSFFETGQPQYYNSERQYAVNNSPWSGTETASQMPGFPSMPDVPYIPANIEYQGGSQPEQNAQASTVENATVVDNLEPMGIKESRMTREKTIYVPGGRIIKTTTTVFTPTEGEKSKGKDVQGVPEDKVGIVVVDKEGNVDVESGDWLVGFNRIEGWEVDALLSRSKRWRPREHRNGVRRGIAKRPVFKKVTPLRKAAAHSRVPTALNILPTSPKFVPNSSKSKTPEALSMGHSLDFIPFEFPPSSNIRSTKPLATRISKPRPQPAKKSTAKKPTPAKKPAPEKKIASTKKATPAKKIAPAKKATPAKKASTAPKSTPIAKIKTPTPSKPRAATKKSAKSASPPARSLRSTTATKSSTSKSKVETLKSQIKAVPHKAVRKNVPARPTGTLLRGFTRNTAELENQVQSQAALADQAAENMERFRGKGADQAAKDFEALMAFVEKGQKELETRRDEPFDS